MTKMRSMLNAVLSVTLAASLMFGTSVPTAKAYTKGEEIADYAEKLVGISGRPNIITDYWGGLVTEWCAMAIVYVGDKVGVTSFPRSTFVDKSGEYIGFRDWFAERNRFYYRGQIIPKPGDLIIFDYDRDDHGDHIGFVDYADTANNLVHTIEGNANDRMAKMTYSISNANILGYCRPDYNDGSYTAAPVTTTTPANKTPTTTVPTAAQPSANSGTTVSSYIVTSSIGCNLRSRPDFSSSSIMEILDTDTVLYPVRTEGSFIYVKTNAGKYGYVHTSAVSPSGQKNYTYGCKSNYYVSSVYGCYIYSSPYGSDNTARILDYNQKLTLLSQGDEYSYAEVTLYNGNVLNGYVKNSAVSPIGSNTGNNTSSGSNITLSGTSYNSCGCTSFTGTKYVASDIGCKLRSQPNYNDSNVMYVLDTYTPVKVISAHGDFYYCSLYVNQELVYGYIHPSVLS